MTNATPTRHPTGRQVRRRQRLAHLLTGVLLVLYVYAAPAMDSGVTLAVRLVVMPVLVISGLLLWQWPRVRSRLRRRMS